MSAEQRLEFAASEPFFPSGCFQTSPVLGILVDDHKTPAGPHYATHLGHGFLYIDGVLERFGGERGVKNVIAKRQICHRPATRRYALRRSKAQHRLRQIESDNADVGVVIHKNTREPALSAADIQDATVLQIPKEAQN